MKILKINVSVVPPYGITYQVFAQNDEGKFIVGTMPVVHRKDAPAYLDKLVDQLRETGQHVTIDSKIDPKRGFDTTTFGQIKVD